jgi:hypothetical protein
LLYSLINDGFVNRSSVFLPRLNQPHDRRDQKQQHREDVPRLAFENEIHDREECDV